MEGPRGSERKIVVLQNIPQLPLRRCDVACPFILLSQRNKPSKSKTKKQAQRTDGKILSTARLTNLVS
jgi:hypothetical protein